MLKFKINKTIIKNKSSPPVLQGVLIRLEISTKSNIINIKSNRQHFIQQ